MLVIVHNSDFDEFEAQVPNSVERPVQRGLIGDVAMQCRHAAARRHLEVRERSTNRRSRFARETKLILVRCHGNSLAPWPAVFPAG